MLTQVNFFIDFPYHLSKYPNRRRSIRISQIHSIELDGGKVNVFVFLPQGREEVASAISIWFDTKEQAQAGYDLISDQMKGVQEILLEYNDMLISNYNRRYM
jgi:hypothetical protein